MFLHSLEITDIAGLQNEDGSFAGDEWGEVDTRYVLPSALGGPFSPSLVHPSEECHSIPPVNNLHVIS